MILILMTMWSLIVNILANKKNQLVYDYFKHKEVTDFVGFTCNAAEGDLVLQKMLNAENIATSLHKLSNLSSIMSLVQIKSGKLGVFVDVDCYDRAYLDLMISDASDIFTFGELHIWLILSANMLRALKIIDDRSFGVSTDFVISTLNDNKKSYALYDVYNLCKEHGGILNITSLGSWDEARGLRISLKQGKIPRRSNFNEMILRSVYYKMKLKPLYMPINVYLQQYRYPIHDGQNKFGYHILILLADFYNFTLQLYEAPPPKANDTFGMHARFLSRNLVDTSGSSLLVTSARLNSIKYVHQAWPLRSCFIFRHPQPNRIKVQEVFRPFSNQVWHYMALAVTKSVLILTVLISFEKYHNIFNGWSDAVLITVGAVSQQATSMEIIRISTRIAVWFVMIFALLIFNYYSSSFVSARLSEQITKINDSLVELGKLKLRLVSEPMVTLSTLLSFPDWDSRTFYRNYWLKIPKSQQFMEPYAGIRSVQRGGFAYHTLPDTGYPIIRNLFSNSEICELTEVHLARPKLTFFVVRYNSSFTEAARVGLAKISEVGLRHRQLLRWKERKPVCRTDILSASSINMDEFASHLILLLFGVISSMFLFLLEIIVFNYQVSLRSIISCLVHFREMYALK